MIDTKYWRRTLVNDVLPRRLKLAAVASGVINYRRYKKKALELARNNGDIDIDRVKTCIGKRDFRGAWSAIYYPAVGEYIEAISEVEFHSVIEYSLNHILFCDLVNGQKNYPALGLDFPMLSTIGFIRGGKLCATDGKNQNQRENGSLERVRIDPNIDYIAKPAGIDSGAGRAVTVVSGRDLPNRLEELSSLSKLLIVQPVFQGHDFFRALNPSSLNTIRCMTLMEGGRPRLLSAVQRVGRKGGVIDNLVSGGAAIGVDDRGCLKDHAIDKDLRPIQQLPNTDIAFAGLRIPHYQSMIDLCLEVHSGLRNLGLLSWDVALSREGMPVIVEINCSNQAINMHQATNPGCLLPLSPYRLGWFERMAHVWSRYPTNSDLRAT